MQVKLFVSLSLGLSLFGLASASTIQCDPHGSRTSAYCVHEFDRKATIQGAYPGKPGTFYGCTGSEQPYCCPNSYDKNVKNGVSPQSIHLHRIDIFD
ncbi:hypothetical protein PSTT_15162 [Puccinia striiformis]|uniref:Uncharacterized protein n=1 Tax=Puccinia striiformis TaxID=27350 RepID=A0A2S4UIX7_9BASI|nr:hypothetical protein PSTT_15162 [Puccinia striiformis]